MSIELRELVGLVLHFRTPARTLKCLRSLVGEGIRSVVLVDNSEDGGASLISMSPGLEELRTTGTSIRLLTPENNLGFAKGANVGIALALECGAKAVLLINSDAQVEQRALTPLLSCLEKAGVCIPRVRSLRDLRSVESFRFYHPATAILAHRPKPGFMPYASGCCLMIRSDVIIPPFFDEDFFFYGEDVLLSQNLWARRVRIMECPDAVIFHEDSGSAKNGSMFYEYHMNRAHWLLARKLATHPINQILYTACRCITLPMRALVRSLKFRSFTPLCGLVTATIDIVMSRWRSFTPPAK